MSIVHKSIKMEKELAEDIARVARKTNRSFSGLIRQISEEYLKNILELEKKREN